MVTMKKSVTMEAVKSLLLEWDGDGSGLEAVETAGGTLYKAADVIIQNEDIPGMTVTDNEGKETLVTDGVYNDMISRSLVGDGFAAKVAGLVWIAQKEAQAPGAKLPGGGIWLLKKQDGSYPKKVVLPAYREAFLQGEKPDGEQGESMGGGSVNSVNGVKPDASGNVNVLAWEETVKGETIEWDGNTEGLVPDSENYCFKLSDTVFTEEELVGAVAEVETEFGVETLTLKLGDPGQGVAGIPTEGYEGFFPVFTFASDGSHNAILYVCSVPDEYFPVPGLYFVKDEDYKYRIVSLTFPDRTEIKTIDPKFLPEGVPYDDRKTEEVKIDWDGNTEGLVVDLDEWSYKVSDLTPSIDDFRAGAKAVLIENGERIEHTFLPQVLANQINQQEGYFECRVDGNGYVCVCTDPDAPNCPFPQTGIYFAKWDEGYVESFSYNKVVDGEFKPLDKAFLPDITCFVGAGGYLYSDRESMNDPDKRISSRPLLELYATGCRFYVEDVEIGAVMIPVTFATDPHWFGVGCICEVDGACVWRYFFSSEREM